MPSSPGGGVAIEGRGKRDNYTDDNNADLIITYRKADGWVGIFEIDVIHRAMRSDTGRKALLARYKATEKNEARVNDPLGTLGTDIQFEELHMTKEKKNAGEEEDIFSHMNADEKSEIDEESLHISHAMRCKERKSVTTLASNT